MKTLLTFVAIGLTLAGSASSIPFKTGKIFGQARRLEGELAKKAWAVGIEKGRLYVGGSGFLSVYDVSADPLDPKLLGTTDDMATVRQLAVQDGMVYVVTRANGLWIVDCRDGTPRTVGHYPSVSNCTGVDVAGNVCFIAGSKDGLEFIDVTDPTRPQLIANRIVRPMESQSVAYRDGYLYSGEWNAQSVTIWDCRDMRDIRQVAVSPLVSNGDGVWPQGRWLYACTGWNVADKKADAQPHAGQMGLTVFDVADPASPKQVGRVDFEWCKGAGLDMWIPRACGHRVFCAQNLSGLYAVNVQDPTRPRVCDRWTWTSATGDALKKLEANGQPSKCVASVAIGDGVVYVAGPSGLGAWAVPAKTAKYEPLVRGIPPINASARPTRPDVSDEFVRWLPTDMSKSAIVTGLAIKDDVCYAACGTAGLHALALSETGFREISSLPLAECTDVSIAGNRLFAANGRSGFVGYEIMAPGRLKEVLRIPSKGARDVYAYGDGSKWISCNSSVYDISDVANPRLLVTLVHQARWAKFMGPDLIVGRWVIGNTALNYFGWADLQADSVAEVKIEGYKSRVGAVCALGDKALMVDNGKWAILEPGAKTAPALKKLPPDGCTGNIPRSCGKIVALTSGKSVGVWDFSDETSPRHLRTYKTPTSVEPVGFWNGHVVIPASDAGVLLVKEKLF